MVPKSSTEGAISRNAQCSISEYFCTGGNFLGFTEYNFKPYSLRRGGATYDYRVGGRLEATIVRGRWQNAKTARIYITDGLARWAEISLEPTTHQN